MFYCSNDLSPSDLLAARAIYAELQEHTHGLCRGANSLPVLAVELQRKLLAEAGLPTADPGAPMAPSLTTVVVKRVPIPGEHPGPARVPALGEAPW